MNTVFPPRLRAAGIVGRWSVIWTLKPDNVGLHTFFVSIYALLIARLIDWRGSTETLLIKSLIHDVDELITGDIVGPVKHEIIDARLSSNLIARKMSELMPSLEYDMLARVGQPFTEQPWETKAIIKAADRLDALFFMLMEQALGNGVIGSRIPHGLAKLREAWFGMPGGEIMLLNKWQNVIEPAIEAHKDPRNYDIG